jgi:hypothetical protein
MKVCALILLAYPLSGLALGLADPLLGQLALQVGAKAGVATAASVNLVLPLVAVALGLACARYWAVCLGALAMTVGLALGLAARYSGGWSVPPVLVGAALGYAVLGTLATFARRACLSGQ